MERLTPPPVRRIVLDAEPTVVGHRRRPTAVTERRRDRARRPARRARLGPAPVRPARHASRLERMRAEELTIAYGGKVAVDSVTLPVRQGEVLALIGPSGCGKTTLLRSLNRLVELTPTARRGGRILLDGEDVDVIEVTDLRRRVSMVFQQPNPFPMSVFDNVAYALREQGSRRPGKRRARAGGDDALERAGLLRRGQRRPRPPGAAALGRPAAAALHRPLAGGAARGAAARRAVLGARPALDGDDRGADRRSCATEVAVVIVTHNLQQAYRVADHVAFMYLGDLVEYGPAEQVFGEPRAQRTRDYVSGAFG